MAKIKCAKIKYTYTHYIAELSGGEIFLTQKFKTRIIFTAKISRSTVSTFTVHYCIAYCCPQGIGPHLSFPAWLRGAEGSNHRYLQPWAWLLCHGFPSPGLGMKGDRGISGFKSIWSGLTGEWGIELGGTHNNWAYFYNISSLHCIQEYPLYICRLRHIQVSGTMREQQYT